MPTPGQTIMKQHTHSDCYRGVARGALMALIGGMAITCCLGSHAQTAPIKRVGFLSDYSRGCEFPPDYPIPPRLLALGWIDGQNLILDCVPTVGRLDRLQELAHELVSRQPDLLMASPAAYVQALMKETPSIPIVMLATSEPVRSALVSNLARPDRNVTGVARFGIRIFPKHMELLKEAVPNLGGTCSETRFPAVTTLCPCGQAMRQPGRITPDRSELASSHRNGATCASSSPASAALARPR